MVKNFQFILQIVNDCNEGARKMERMEEICVLQTQIEFKTKVRKWKSLGLETFNFLQPGLSLHKFTNVFCVNAPCPLNAPFKTALSNNLMNMRMMYSSRK